MFAIRAARPTDVPAIDAMIRELAEYEKLPVSPDATAEGLHAALFGSRPVAEALVAEAADAPAGFALFFPTYATFAGKPGIYLEDLYVRPALRGQGIGKALICHLAKLAFERGCGRLEWTVLNWNEPAVRFYRTLGALPMSEWTTQRLAGESLSQLASWSSFEKRV